MFLRLAIVDSGASLCLTVPPNWTVFQLKQHLAHGLHGLLSVDAMSLQLYTASEPVETAARRWIAYSDPDAMALLQRHVTDGVQRLMTNREMDDTRRLRDFDFDAQLDAVHVLVRCHAISSRHDEAWMDCLQAWRPWVPYACLFFTTTLFVAWLDTIVTWLHHCESNWELVRNLPWVLLSTTLFIASVYVYLKDIACTQARKGYVEMA